MSAADTIRKWQPIETAPKDRRVLGYNGEIVTEMLWLNDKDDDDHIGWCCAGFTGGGMLYYHHNEFEPKPTQWMHLPPAPNKGEDV